MENCLCPQTHESDKDPVLLGDAQGQWEKGESQVDCEEDGKEMTTEAGLHRKGRWGKAEDHKHPTWVHRHFPAAQPSPPWAAVPSPSQPGVNKEGNNQQGHETDLQLQETNAGDSTKAAGGQRLAREATPPGLPDSEGTRTSVLVDQIRDSGARSEMEDLCSGGEGPASEWSFNQVVHSSFQAPSHSRDLCVLSEFDPKLDLQSLPSLEIPPMDGKGSEVGEEPMMESSLAPNRLSVVCLPLVSEGLKLVWAQSEEIADLDGVQELVDTFNTFPYPTLQEVVALARRCALPLDRVKVWFMVQRIRYGISWASEEIEETRLKVCGRHRERERREEEYGWGTGVEERDVPPPFPCKRAKCRHAPCFSLSPSGYGKSGIYTAPSPLFSVVPPPGRWHSNDKKLKSQLMELRHSFEHQTWVEAARDYSPEDPEERITSGDGSWELGKDAGDAYLLESFSREGRWDHAEGQSGIHKKSWPRSKVKVEEEENERRDPAADHLIHAISHKEAVNGQPPSLLSPSPSPSPSSSSSTALWSRSRRRKKTKEQLDMLKEHFLHCQWPSRKEYTRLVELTGLPRHKVIQWFGDTRYAVKNGQLRWIKDEREQIVAEITQQQLTGGGPGGRRGRRAKDYGGQGLGNGAPPAHPLQQLADTYSNGCRTVASHNGHQISSGTDWRTDISPLEGYWQRDLDGLSQDSNMVEVEVNISD